MSRSRGRDLVRGSIGLQVVADLPGAAAGVQAQAAAKLHEGAPLPAAMNPLIPTTSHGGGSFEFDIGASATDAAPNTITIEGVTYLKVSGQFTVPTHQIWEVRALHCGMGTGPFTANQKGIFYFFTSGGRTFSGWRDAVDISASPGAGSGFYSAGQFPIYGGHGLSAIVGGYTASTVYQWTATIIAFDKDTHLPVVRGA